MHTGKLPKTAIGRCGMLPERRKRDGLRRSSEYRIENMYRVRACTRVGACVSVLVCVYVFIYHKGPARGSGSNTVR